MSFDCYFIFKTNMPSVLLEVLLKNYGFENPYFESSNETSKLMTATTKDETLINQFKDNIVNIIQDYSQPLEIENIDFYYCERPTSGTMGEIVENMPKEVIAFLYT